MHSIFSRAAMPALTLCLGAALAAVPGTAKADSDHDTTPLADTHAPAGVMFDHMHKAGEFMVGFRYAYTSASGDMLNGSDKASDQEIIDNGCKPHTCSMVESDMALNMYMLDIMYAPTDWVTLMVMPMYMSHDMTMRPLKSSMSATGHMEHMEMPMDDTMGMAPMAVTWAAIPMAPTAGATRSSAPNSSSPAGTTITCSSHRCSARLRAT